MFIGKAELSLSPDGFDIILKHESIGRQFIVSNEWEMANTNLIILGPDNRATTCAFSKALLRSNVPKPQNEDIYWKA